MSKMLPIYVILPCLIFYNLTIYHNFFSFQQYTNSVSKENSALLPGPQVHMATVFNISFLPK